MALSNISMFVEPRCLISSDASNKLTIEKDVLDQLSGVTEQLNVVTIAGLYRTGKSYLLTRLAKKYKGFPLGSTIESKTKGIWAWCIKHPVHQDQMLLLLDTEGLGDIRKGNQNHDNKIFTLAVLLSSTLIYNTFGAFDQDALNKLNFVTEISKNMKTSDGKSGSTDADFDLYFPEFILALRDFTLDLEAGGMEMTTDEYLEYCLKLMCGEGEEIERFNEPKRCLRKYFKNRKCFVFEPPAKPRQLKKLEDLQDEDLDEDFVKNTRMFTDYVHNKCRPLTLMNGKPVNGRMFASLVTHYVESISNGAVPCVESALKSMAIIENEKAVKNTIAAYVNEMNRKLSIPTPDEKTMLDVHHRCKVVAFNLFKKQSVMDEGKQYKGEADKKIEKEFEKFVHQNHQESNRRCEDALKQLHSVIANKLQSGIYTVAGGYKLYRADRMELERNYFAMTDLGLNKQNMYVDFSHLTKNEEESILKSDEMVTTKEKETEIERQNTKRAQERELILQQQLENNEDTMKEMKAQLDKELQILNEQHEKDIEHIRDNYEAIINKRVDEITRLEEENMTKLSERYREDLTTALNEKEEKDKDARRQMKEDYERRLTDLEDKRAEQESDIKKANDRYTELLEEKQNGENGFMNFVKGALVLAPPLFKLVKGLLVK